jgi:hypothetical protein
VNFSREANTYMPEAGRRLWSSPHVQPSAGGSRLQDMSKDHTYPLVPVLSLLSSIFILIPFFEYGLRRTLNSGVVVFVVWVLVMALHIGIDAIVWSGTTADFAPVWCDICTFSFLL